MLIIMSVLLLLMSLASMISTSLITTMTPTMILQLLNSVFLLVAQVGGDRPSEYGVRMY